MKEAVPLDNSIYKNNLQTANLYCLEMKYYFNKSKNILRKINYFIN